uniref:10-formyltetrahydrofolate dehydrogenase n=1 Tax=Acrobeloides nanus TaxID=290746 RepID=A0A914D700_9BILA
MKIAVIGKSAFGADVYKQLREAGHEVVVVCTEPDKNGRADLLALEAEKDGTPVIKTAKWRRKNAEGKWEVLPDLFEQYKSYGAELNILPFCTQFIPQEVIDAPVHKTIIYHPSILPAHRGASAINWTLINGDAEAGLTLFWADEGVDTGPILLQRKCQVEENDTLNSLYKRFLYPEGVKACVDAANLVAQGKAPRIPQPEEGASYEAYITVKPELAQIDWTKTQREVHNFIRGNDKVPGSWTTINGQKVTLFGSSLWKRPGPPFSARAVEAEGVPGGVVWAHDGGLILKANDGKYINIENLKFEDGKMIKGSEFGLSADETNTIEYTAEEKALIPSIKEAWKGILNFKIDDDTNFFDAGASSADLTRLLEDVKTRSGVELEAAEVYMNASFGSFMNALVKKLRGDTGPKLEFKKLTLDKNNMTISFPTQMFIGGKFVDSESGRWMETVDPGTEQKICDIPKGSAKDVDSAVRAAEEAFNYGEWSRISPRERGKLLFKLADLMEEHREELATIESIDSGAVYTLALKTHVGMSIDVWRYFAGWMLSWKMAACLAAGNTVVHKPAQVCPLTALKFAELAARAGIPPGVINIITGTGSEVGQAIADHPKIRKLGFTGSTEVGAHIMTSCAKSNLKKVSLELGGKSPLIIFPDVDLNRATRQACDAVFFNKGENCIAAGRLFVEEKIYDEFVNRVVELASKMVIGDPLDRKTDHGPQNHMAHLKSLISYVEKSVAGGAKLVFGGKRVERQGLFFYPTVLTDVEEENYAATNESFGPVMIISRFSERDVDDVIERANRTEYGLAAGVFSKDTSRAMRVGRRIKAGTVFINTYQKTDVAAPFGGVKQSGFGKDLGEEALNEYLQTKTVTMEY